MSNLPEKKSTTLANILFRREALVFLITLVCAVLIFILSLNLIFQTMWDQATQSVRLEVEREADTIARLLVFEFSHLTELETQADPDRGVDKRIERLLWEKVTFNEIIRGIELIRRQSNSQGQHLTYSFFPLSHASIESEQGPQKSLKTFTGPEGDLIRVINREQRVDRNLLESINRGRKIESELLLRYFPLYIPLPDQGAVYWGVAKVGINADALRRFIVLLEDEKTALRRTLIVIMGIVTALALALGLLGFRLLSRRTAAPLGDYEMMNTAMANDSGADIESLLAHLKHQESQGIREFDQLQNFCLRLGGTIKSLGERLIETERQACLGRLAARLAQTDKLQGISKWNGLFHPLPEEWREVDLEPYFGQIHSLITALAGKGSLVEDRQAIPHVYTHEANLVQAFLFLVDFALAEMTPGSQIQWRVQAVEPDRVAFEIKFSGRTYSQAEVSGLFKPFKTGREHLPPLGPFLAAAIARQHGGSLVVQANQEGGLRQELKIPAHKGSDKSGIDSAGI